jgi:hypothetical protein
MSALPRPPHYLDLDLSVYAGSYIGLVEGRVVAVALTPGAARARARAAREQREPTILYISPIAGVRTSDNDVQ